MSKKEMNVLKKIIFIVIERVRHVLLITLALRSFGKKGPSSLFLWECDKAMFFCKFLKILLRTILALFFFCKFPVFFIHTSFSFPFLFFLVHRILSIANDYFFCSSQTQFKLYFSNLFIFSYSSPKWLLRNEEKNFLWVLARSFHCSLFHLAFDDIDHLPHALTNESENLYVNTIGKLFFFLSFFFLRLETHIIKKI